MRTKTLSFTLSGAQAAHLKFHLSQPSGFQSETTFSTGLQRALEQAGLFEQAPSPVDDLLPAISVARDPAEVLSALMNAFGQMDKPAEPAVDADAADQEACLTLTEDTALELILELKMRKMVFTQPAQEAADIIEDAINQAFDEIQEPVAGQPDAAPDDPAPSDPAPSGPTQTREDASNAAQVAIATEADGDIAGFYIFDSAALEALNAHPDDPWDFLCSDHDKAPAALDTLSQVFAEIERRDLSLTGEFGICVY